MQLVAHLDGNLPTEGRKNEAQNVIARLHLQNISDYKLIPNDSDPTEIEFSYDGRVSHGQSVESSRDQYNNVRDGGTFVSMSQVLQSILAHDGKISKTFGDQYARIPIHLRSRAQPGQPAQWTGDTLVRTISQRTGITQGSWIVLLQKQQYLRHIGEEPSPTPDDDSQSSNLPTPEEIKDKLGLSEDVSIIDNSPLTSSIPNRLSAQLNSSQPTINPQQPNGDISIPQLNRMYNLENRSRQLNNKPRA